LSCPEGAFRNAATATAATLKYNRLLVFISFSCGLFPY
jgi:hypothetical protein